MVQVVGRGVARDARVCVVNGGHGGHGGGKGCDAGGYTTRGETRTILLGVVGITPFVYDVGVTTSGSSFLGLAN